MTVSLIGQGCEFQKADVNSAQQIEAIRFGIYKGLTFLDTAEIYGGGYSEELIGKAIGKIRNKVFIGSKFSPENSSYRDILRSAENTLLRLRTDYIDLYQIHWPNPKIPIAETMAAMEKLVSDGKILRIGVSNFSKFELSEAQKTLSQNKIYSNQVEYNLLDRFVEQEMLSYCQTHGINLIAYSPLLKGRTFNGPESKRLLTELSIKYKMSFSQIALVWLVSKKSVIAIPKSTKLNHIQENAEALHLKIEKQDLTRIDETCSSAPIHVPTNEIKVVLTGEGNKQVYQTLAEAIENKLNLSPSPVELAEFIKRGEITKPVRLVRNSDSHGRYKYDLIEGRLRYWAWVIAYNDQKPIPSYIRYDEEEKRQ
jgi:diketogulonate reductase-like aldo/keto reductase